ncbi:hypothetical protein [Croceicoccus mobilis]|uniref:Uncharacterized protein n=1 Tax=Croceicoccus mobilis TaxID=1703339 RepID=A0A916Z9R3_9SPHN|nr:hypothetical protein [Croceicoccus mobilis]GGD83186.1 hypothetical protein GCM10010990_36570 [Croceicoccus mobilis]
MSEEHRYHSPTVRSIMEAEPEREGQRSSRSASKKASVGTAAFFGLLLIVNGHLLENAEGDAALITAAQADLLA